MPHISPIDLTADYGKFILEPLEKGYGQTIGNALRRVLLSSIQGAAVSAVRIDKVFHEFAPIPGVKEDTTELLLNLKDLAIAIDTEAGMPTEDPVLRIDVQGPGRVTGADVVCPEGIEIVNPEVYIATISDDKASLNMELYIGWGSGYTLPEKQERYRGMIGVIPTGSQYTPVRKVNYTVEATRVGQRTDYERLVLDIWTSGATKPNDALSQAAHILDKYFKMFFDLGRFKREPMAQSLREKIAELGIESSVVPKRRVWGNSYQVLAGPYDDDDAERQISTSLLSHGYKPRPFERGTRDFAFRSKVTIDGSPLPTGNFTVAWESYIADAKVKFSQGNGLLAAADGKWVKHAAKFNQNEYVYQVQPDGSRPLLELHFGGMDRALVFRRGQPD